VLKIEEIVLSIMRIMEYNNPLNKYGVLYTKELYIYKNIEYKKKKKYLQIKQITL
jgi:hypothetical protein